MKKNHNDAAYFSEFSSLLTACTSEIIQSNSQNLSQILDHVLMKIGVFSEVDRVYYFSFDYQASTCSNINEWCKAGVTPQITELQDIPTEILPKWMEKMLKGEEIYIRDLNELDDSWAAEKEILEPQGIQSLLVVPVIEENYLFGFIGFDAVEEKIEWNDNARNLLQILSNNIASVIRRNNQNAELLEKTAAADAASLAKSQFLANISHEIRTPINSVIGFSELLKSTSLDLDQKVFVNGLNESAHFLFELVNQILDFTKIEAGKVEINREKTNLHELANSVHKTLMPLAKKKDIDFELRIDIGESDYVLLDETRIRQVLINLVSNGIKFTEHGFVRLSLEKRSEIGNKVNMRFSVQDSGIGISAEQQKNLFSVFSQGDNSTSKKYGGSGLGLVISSGILELMDSKIICDSSPKNGSLFYFDMELDTCEPETKELKLQEITSPKVEFTTNEKLSTLIVDDNVLNLLLLKAMLQQVYPSLTIQEAADGYAALELMKSFNPDFIIMDIQMPEMDGRETTKKIRALNYKLPIIACTASVTEGERELCLDAGMNDYIAKPISKELLTSILEKNIPQLKILI
ncbi:MAG: response regulator [Bacteroidetes bacterium]|nr:response regulator [Bacteroidota bacterium]